MEVISTPAAAIDILSDDVLYIIFQYCAEINSQGDTRKENDSIRTDRYPWVLSYVSSRWRVLALSCPLLWCKIKINMDVYVPSRRRTASLPLLLSLTLQRTRDVELYVEIRDVERRGCYERLRYNLINYLAPLLSTTSRWRELKISTYPEFLKGLSGCSFKSLCSLRMGLLGNTDQDRSLNLFCCAAKLTRLQLDSSASGGRWYNNYFPGVIESITLPWSGLRSFTTPVDGLVNLPQMPYLEELHIIPGASLTIEPSSLPLPRLTLPYLHTITSAQFVGPILRKVSRRITAPALRTLDLNIQCPVRLKPYLPDFEDIDKVVELSVKFKVGSGGSKVDAHVIAFLSRARSVETLTLGSNCVGAQAMLRAIGRGQILPKLTTMCLHISIMCEDVEGDVISMIERRVRCPAKPISEVRVIHSGWHRERLACGGPMSLDAIVTDAGMLERWAALGKLVVIRYVCDG